VAYSTAFSKRRKQIWEALHPESRIVLEVAQDAPLQEKKHGGVRANQLSQGFAAATAEATGQSKATTNRAIARADALGDEALAKVVNTSSAFGKVATSAAAATDTAPVVTAVFSSATPPDKASAYCPARFTVAGLTLYFVANLSAVEAGSF